MNDGLERIECVRRALDESAVDALVCALPMNVLMLSGYWPVLGASLVIFKREGRVTLLVPEDEKELAENGWADEVYTFSIGSLTELKGVVESVSEPLADAARDLGLGRGRVVGFSAIDHNAPPRLHPASDDVLETGMVFNVEPAVYVEGYGGLRHCDVVAVTESGASVLTPFQSSLEQLTVGLNGDSLENSQGVKAAGG